MNATTTFVCKCFFHFCLLPDFLSHSPLFPNLSACFRWAVSRATFCAPNRALDGSFRVQLFVLQIVLRKGSFRVQLFVLQIVLQKGSFRVQLFVLQIVLQKGSFRVQLFVLQIVLRKGPFRVQLFVLQIVLRMGRFACNFLCSKSCCAAWFLLLPFLRHLNVFAPLKLGASGFVFV